MNPETPSNWIKRLVGTLLDLILSLFRIVLCVLSLKVFPFSWHIRVFCTYFLRYKLVQRPGLPTTCENLAIFQPTVFVSQVTLGEMDYFGHKSNSTYPLDIDFARSHHIYSLFRQCARHYESRFNAPDTVSAGRFNFALGGITSVFKKSLTLFQRYEIWTRVCYWDDKWVYLISHFVKEGCVKPGSYSDSTTTQTAKNDLHRSSDEDTKDCDEAVLYAVVVSKVVFKEGRKTIPPAVFFESGDLLPEREDEVASGGEHNRLDTVDKEMGGNNNSRLWEAINREKSRGRTTMESIQGLEDGVGLFDKDVQFAFRRY